MNALYARISNEVCQLSSVTINCFRSTVFYVFKVRKKLLLQEVQFIHNFRYE